MISLYITNAGVSEKLTRFAQLGSRDDVEPGVSGHQTSWLLDRLRTHRSLFTLWDASWWFPSFTLHPDISTPPHASCPSSSATSNQRSNRRFPARYRGCVPQSAVQNLPQHRRCDAPEWRRWANLHLWRHPRNGSLQLLSGTETKALPPLSKFQRSCWSKIQFGPNRPLRCWIGNNAATLVLLDLLLSDFWRASYSHIDWDPLCEALGVEPQNGRQLRVPRPDLAAGHSSLRRFLASKSNVEVHPDTLAVGWPGYEPLAVGFPASEASENPQRSRFRHLCSWRGPQSSRSTTGPKQFPPWHLATAATTTWGLMYWWRRHLSPSFGETVATDVKTWLLQPVGYIAICSYDFKRAMQPIKWTWMVWCGFEIHKWCKWFLSGSRSSASSSAWAPIQSVLVCLCNARLAGPNQTSSHVLPRSKPLRGTVSFVSTSLRGTLSM